MDYKQVVLYLQMCNIVTASKYLPESIYLETI